MGISTANCLINGLSLQTLQKKCSKGCRHSSVDSSAPSNLPPWVWVPSTPSMLFSIYNVQIVYLSFELECEKKENKQKEAGLCLSQLFAPFLTEFPTVTSTLTLPTHSLGFRTISLWVRLSVFYKIGPTSASFSFILSLHLILIFHLYSLYISFS